MKYCQQCGSAVEDGAEFCKKCGTQVKKETPEPQAQQVNVTINNPQAVSAEMSKDSDNTLRLIAFIFSCLSLAGFCWLIIPLAWMIPMTVITWGIYKGTRKNTVAFGVCSLLFLNLVTGILLLCSTKDE